MTASRWQERITMDPDVLAGKPVLAGTRVPVELVLDLLARGWTSERVLQNYPQLSREDVLAALAYARDCVKVERIYPASGAAAQE